MTDEKLYQVALQSLAGVGDVVTRQLVSYCGSASAIFAASPARLLRVPGVGEVTARAVRQGGKAALAAAERELRALEKHPGVRLLFYTDPAYPDRLKRIYDAPVLLYYRGAADLNAPRTLGIVGTRQATDYGRAVCEEIVEAMQPYNPLVVSGLAYGVDIAAHRACLQHRVPTVGVMATGIDLTYPAVHRKYAEAMVEQGGLLTENPLGSKPDAPRFPARNRIIAGLCDALIVVEAAAKGGALITAEYANNYHKDVFAVPGDLHRPASVGCNLLIQQNKAAIYTSAQAVAELLNWHDDAAEGGSVSSARPLLTDGLTFTDEESQVIAQLRSHRDMLMDDLSWQTQIPINRLASLLLNLEFQGVVKAMPGKKFALL